MTTPRLPEVVISNSRSGEAKSASSFLERKSSDGSDAHAETKRSGASFVAEISSLSTQHSLVTPSLTNSSGALVPSETKVSSALSLTSQESVLTSEEKEWRNHYYHFAANAIENRDLDALTLILGPERYFAWAEYIREMHEAQQPRSSMFHSCALEFIKLYEEKLEKDEQYKIYKSKLNRERLFKSTENYSGNLEEAHQDPICIVYEKALEDYKKNGISAYFKTIEPIKDKLSCVVTPRSTLLLDEKTDFDAQLTSHLELMRTQSLNAVKANLECEIKALAETRNRAMNMQGYQDRYFHPFIEKYELLTKEIFEDFDKYYKDSFKHTLHFPALKQKIKEAQKISDITEKEDEEKFSKTENDQENLLKAKVFDEHGQMKVRPEKEYYNVAIDIYLARVEKIKDETFKKYQQELNYRQPLVDASAGITPKQSFINHMLQLRLKMGIDVFDRMVDNEGHTLLYHALRAYRGCTEKERKQLTFINDMLLKQGCSPYSDPYSCSRDSVNQRVSYSAFEYANRQEEKSREKKDSPGKRDLPDWPLLKSMHRFNLLTLSPAEDLLRINLGSYSKGKQELFGLGAGSVGHLASLYNMVIRYFQNEEITDKRRADVIELTEGLYQSALVGTDGAIFDKVRAILGEIKTIPTRTGRRGRSELGEMCDFYVKLAGNGGKKNNRIITFSNSKAVSPSYLKTMGPTDLTMKQEYDKKIDVLKKEVENQKQLQIAEAERARLEIAELEQKLVAERQARNEKEAKISQELVETRRELAEMRDMFQQLRLSIPQQMRQSVTTPDSILLEVGRIGNETAASRLSSPAGVVTGRLHSSMFNSGVAVGAGAGVQTVAKSAEDSSPSPV